MEALPIFPRSEPHDPVEYLPEGAGVGIADIPRDALHRQTAELQQLLGLRDPQALRVFGCCETGSLLETAQQRALFQSGLFGQRREARIPSLVRLQEMLNLEDGRIAMGQAGREAAVIALLPPRRVHEHHPGRLRHHDGAEEAVDQLEAEIGPGHQPTCRDDVAAVDDQAVCIEHDMREPLKKLLGVDPMRSCRSRVQQSCLREQERAATDRRECRTLGMALAQPACERSRDIGLDGRFEGRRKNQDMTRGVIACSRCRKTVSSRLDGSDLELRRALIRAICDPSSDPKEVRQPHRSGELGPRVEDDADPDLGHLSISPRILSIAPIVGDMSAGQIGVKKPMKG